MEDDESRIAEKFEALHDVMDEQMCRLWAATEARALGHGGVSVVARAVGLTRPTITAGMKELGDTRQRVPMASSIVCAGPAAADGHGCGVAPGAGGVGGAGHPRPSDVAIALDLQVRTLAAELSRQGHPVSHQTGSEVLQHLGYSLQVNRKTREGPLGTLAIAARSNIDCDRQAQS